MGAGFIEETREGLAYVFGHPIARAVVLAVAVKILSGVGNGLENVAADTTLQKGVDRPMLGRAFGVFYGGVMLAEALGTALGGLLLELTSPRGAFVIAGAATLAVTLLAWRLPRSSRGTSLRSPG